MAAFSNLQHYDKFQELNVERLSGDLTSSPVSLMGDGDLERGGGGGGFSESVYVAEVPVGSRGAYENGGDEGKGRNEGIPKGKVKAARPRGGGIEEDEQKSRRDYRRFSATTIPPAHQPAYQPPHATELPTHEHPSGSAVGCGSLPGSSKEFGVARLPDERGKGNPYIFSQATLSETVFTGQGGQMFKSMLKHQGGWGVKPGVQMQKGKQQQAGKQTQGEAGQIQEAKKATKRERKRERKHAEGEQEEKGEKKWELPTTEIPSGSRVGVGSLPGDISEAGVATLPMEREGGKPYGSGYTGFEDYTPAEGAKMMHAHMNEHSHRHAKHGGGIGERVGEHFARGDHHTMPKIDLPLEEEPSGSRMGVGSLPGLNSEAGVALLPEERRRHLDDEVAPSLFMPTTEDLTISYGGVGSLPGKRGEQGVAMTPEERLFPADGILGSHLPPRMDEMPLEEHPSGSVVGVGSLPGTIEEAGVAVLPDERKEEEGWGSLWEGGVSRGREREVKEVRGGLKQGAWKAGTTKPTMTAPSKQGATKPATTKESTKPTTTTKQTKKQGEGETREERMERDIRGLCEAQKTCEHRAWIRGWGWGVEEGTTPTTAKKGWEGAGVQWGGGTTKATKATKAPATQGTAAKAKTHEGKTKSTATTQAKAKAMGAGEHGIQKKGGKHAKQETQTEIQSWKGKEDWKGVGVQWGTARREGERLSTHERVVAYFEGVDHHVMPKVDLPTHEELSGSRMGVGSLPGARTEAGVAVLPEERRRGFLGNEIDPSLYMPSTEADMLSIGGVGSLPGKRSERGVVMLPEERLFPADDILTSHLPPRADQLPSTERISGSEVGVGSLPGKRSEQRVALTPEERLHPAYDILTSHLPPRMDQMPSREHISGSTIGVGSLPGQRTEKGVALTPEERQHPADQILMRKKKDKAPFGRGGHGQSRRKSEGTAAHVHASGAQATRAVEGQQVRRRGEKDEGHEGQEREHVEPGGATELGRKPSLHGRPGAQQKSAQGTQAPQQQQQQQQRPIERTLSTEIDEERKRVEHHFEMARRAAELVNVGMTTAVEGVGSVVSGITAPSHYHQPQTAETIEADRQRAVQRGEMMRHTMERFESSIEGVGNRVRHAFGWDHPAVPSGDATTVTATQGQVQGKEGAGPRAEPTKKTGTSGGVPLSTKEIREEQQKRVEAERTATQEQQARLDRVVASERQRATSEGSEMRAGAEKGVVPEPTTMQMLEGGVSAAAEGVGRGIGDVGHALEDMGHKVWESVGRHTAGTQPTPAASTTQKAASGAGHFITVPRGSSTESTHAVHSNLSPTAPEFVPSHFRSSTQQQQQPQHGDQGNEGSWWPHVAVGTAPPLADVMKDVRERVEGYLHLGHGEEGQAQDKRGQARQAAPPLPHPATPTMDRLAGHATRASDRGGKISDRISDNSENVDRGTTDDARAHDGEERMRQLREAEELLRRAAHEEQKMGVVIGRKPPEQGGKAKPVPLAQHGISEATLQREAGVEGEVTTLESSGQLGSAKAPLGMPTRQEGKQTSVPSNLYEQYFATGGKEGEVTTLSGAGEFGTTRPAEGKETLRGVGGVGFSMKPGEGGVLPGYPTAQGMSQLMRERVADDQARAGKSLGGGETTTTLKAAPHLESNIGAHREKISRAESDISVRAVHGSTSDLNADVFTGNKTPRPVGMASPMGMLGAPVPKYGQQEQQQGSEYGRYTQKN